MSLTIGTGSFRGVLFDMDGVVTDTASLHFAAWRRLFHQLSGEGRFGTVDLSRGDYLEYIDGRERAAGLEAYLLSRGVTLPAKASECGAQRPTIESLAHDKDRYFLDEIAAIGVKTIAPTVRMLQRLHSARIPTALVSASRNAALVLERGEISDYFGVRVDGIDAATLSLDGKPSPEMFLEAARRLKLHPAQCVVIEDAQAGVRAAKNGGFGLSVGLGNDHAALMSNGADVVVDNLDLLDVQLTPTAPRAGDNVDSECAQCQESGEDEWSLEYRGIDPDTAGTREALLTQGNGYFATRGALAETTADGIHYPGVYVAGCYNRLTSHIGDRSRTDESIVNLPNWAHFTFRATGGTWLGTDTHAAHHHHESFDLRRGILRRESVVGDSAGRITRIAQHRLVSMDDPHLAALTTTLTAENWSGSVEVRSGIDAGVTNSNVPEYALLDGYHFDQVSAKSIGVESISSTVHTRQSQIRIAQAERLRVRRSDGAAVEHTRRVEIVDSTTFQILSCRIEQGHALNFEKTATIFTSHDRSISEPEFAARQCLEDSPGNAELSQRHYEAWHELWQRFSTILEGDGMTALATNVQMAHVLQTLSAHTSLLDVGVPARGLHGEAYRGHVFWDELFVLPLLTTRLPELARSLLLYRHRRLPHARRSARDAGLEGAMFPWQSGSDGREETPQELFNPRSRRWMPDNSRRQHHVNLAVAYNVWRYWQTTTDLGFLTDFGAEILVDNARFWSSLAEYDADSDRYDIRGVMGPDEFHDGYPGHAGAGIDNNSYINIMTAWTLVRTLETIAIIGGANGSATGRRLRIADSELAHWEHISRRLRLTFLDNGILSQFENFQSLKELDWADYRARYGDIGRLDLILEAEGDSCVNYQATKQADVLMLLYLFPAEVLTELITRLGYSFDPMSIPRTVDYYVQRTSHGSTLSRVAHTWVLARGNRSQSWEMLTQALSTDLSDSQGGTTREGIHLGAMAGSIDILQRCYTGLDFHADTVWLHPQLPSELDSLAFDIYYRGHWLHITCTHTSTSVSSGHSSAAALALSIHDTVYELAADSVITHLEPPPPSESPLR
ncbi:HAD-IA family hydrolase [Rhodococcus erythropolis]|uniref:HAD-IA family hydrolase n=1 Tax=Rhodococcus erythropolis TaxID=1833 RepID=UPI00382F3F4F